MSKKRLPKPKMSRHRFMLYPVFYKGRIVWVSIPEKG